MNRATDQPGPNPLREGLSTRAVPQPCAIVIFGATGDLTHRKLIPALYNLAADGELPPSVTIVGFARRKKSDDEFRSDLEEATRKFSRQAVRDERTVAEYTEVESGLNNDRPSSRRQSVIVASVGRLSSLPNLTGCRATLR